MRHGFQFAAVFALAAVLSCVQPSPFFRVQPYPPPARDPATADGWILTGTPWIQQTCDKWCWAASVAMIARRYGIDTPLCEIVSACFQTPCCSDMCCADGTCNVGGRVKDVHRAFDRVGLTRRIIYRTLDETALQAELRAGRPVIVMHAHSNGKGAHDVVVAGFLPKDPHPIYYVLDPWPGTRPYAATYAQLLKIPTGSTWELTWYGIEPTGNVDAGPARRAGGR